MEIIIIFHIFKEIYAVKKLLKISETVDLLRFFNKKLETKDNNNYAHALQKFRIKYLFNEHIFIIGEIDPFVLTILES